MGGTMPVTSNFVKIIKPITKYSKMITNPIQIKYELDKAFYFANNKIKGPVWLDIPLDIQNSRLDEKKLKSYSKNYEIKKCSSKSIDKVFFEIKISKRPTILIGSGIKNSNCIKEFKKFVNRYKIPVVYTNSACSILGAENKLIDFYQFDESSSSTFKLVDTQSNYYKRKFRLLNFFGNKKIYQKYKIKVHRLKDYIEKNEIKKIDFIKIDTEGYEFEILLGLENKIKLVDVIMFEHHYDNMIKKGYMFYDINRLLIKKGFKKIYKSKMPFRKTFEYIYQKNKSQ